ncbi:aminoglycoside phosphotransferase family protein [Kitasatospora sp. NPDC093806]|uniref:aminoglycoside phosphotransferase family protein n=1 Tax=Kitasatospora sp. NPDC093806 TaxID=3155075 RepID=UPI003423377F
MKTPPDDLDALLLRTGLHTFGIDTDGDGEVYAPVGYGDHHWTVTGADGRRWFATVADLAHKSHCGPEPESAHTGLRAAMATARALRDLGLDLVVAPEPTPGGETVLRLTDRYALSVFPHTDGATGHFGEPLAPADRARLVDALARLHRAPAPSTAPRRRPDLSARPRLDAALADTGRPWTAGPYAERARALTAEHGTALRRALHRFDRLAAALDDGPAAGPLVVTHGEPHPGNLLRPPGRVLLVDWDTVGLAAPERDLWLTGADEADLARYADATGHTPRPAALALYRLRWALEDVDAYLHWFRSPHTATADAHDSWTALSGTLTALATDPT